jgi:hypothetical protein
MGKDSENEMNIRHGEITACDSNPALAGPDPQARVPLCPSARPEPVEANHP